MRGLAAVLAAAAVALVAAAPATKPTVLEGMSNSYELAHWSSGNTDDGEPWKLAAGQSRFFSFDGGAYAVSTIDFQVKPYSHWSGGSDDISFSLSTATNCASAGGGNNPAFTGPIATVTHGGTIGPDANTFGVPYADVCHSGIQPQTQNGAGPICLIMKCENSVESCYPTGYITFVAPYKDLNSNEEALGNHVSAYSADHTPKNATCGPSAVTSGPIDLEYYSSSNTMCCPNAVIAIPKSGMRTNLRAPVPKSGAKRIGVQSTAVDTPPATKAMVGQKPSKKPSKQ